MSDDWEYSDESCPKCSSQLAWRHCSECGGDGWIEDDDEWGHGDIRCDRCDGGTEEWCRECGWDTNFNCFLSPEYERAYLEKQRTGAGRGNSSGGVATGGASSLD
jgi:hypothetical protein